MNLSIKIIGLIFTVIAASLPITALGRSIDYKATDINTSSYLIDTVNFKINFRFDDVVVLRDFKENNADFARLRSLIEERGSNIDSIVITGFSSPEGWSVYNHSLSQRRAKAMRNYLYWKHPSTRSIPIHLRIEQDMVNSLVQYINRDNQVPRREKVLEILSDESRSIDTRMANLKLISGESYHYINHTIFPQMRMSVSCFVYHRPPIVVEKPTAPACTDVMHPTPPFTEAHTQSYPITLVANTVDTPISCIYKPLLALKTNLLFDAATLLNIEVEVPIGNRWSIAGEWIFPWWLWEKQQHCLQVLSANIEGKYWFGNRKKRPAMTGWHAGLYAGGGYYDLEWNKVGFQGEFFIAAGISAGYAHRINKRGNLRMEYSVGIGYMQTNYRRYDAEQDAHKKWHLYRNGYGRYTWMGPTRARISLVWMIGSQKKGGSVK